MALDGDGDRILVPAGGMDVIDACCCLEEPPNCDCRRMYTGLNTIYQQDSRLKAPEYELLSLFDPIYESSFTSSSNDVDTDDNPGAHRCWELVGCADGGGVGDEGPEEDYPRYYEACISCTDPAIPTTLARPCGWVMGHSLYDDVCLELVVGDEVLGPTWYWVGRNPFRPIDLNHCIDSSIDAGTLTDSGTGGTDLCGVSVLYWCRGATGNQLKFTLTVGGQSLVVWGRWITQDQIKGYWFFLDTDPAIPGIAWSSLPFHRGTVVGWIKLVCNGDGTGTLTIDPNRAPPASVPGCPACWGGTFDWNDGGDIAYSTKSWEVDLTDPSFTVSDSINPETALGGDGDPPVAFSILGEWITI